MRIGLSTGGGDCPGLNSVIRAIVRYAQGKFGYEVIGIEDSFTGLLAEPPRARTLTMHDVSGILNRGGTILGTSNTGNPFRAQDGDNEKAEARIQKALHAYKDLKLDCMIVIGGDGSQRIAHQFHQLGVPVIGIPKTIDNDLLHAEVTVGFETAIEVASDAVVRLQSTAESHDRIMILEVMGRYAGHIALHAGIAGGAHVILIPEIPFHYDAILERLNWRKAQGKHYSVIVVAEGAVELGGQPTFRAAASGRRSLGGIGQVVAERLYNLTGIDTRITVLGHIQRGGQPCPRDRILGTLYGVKAVDMVRSGTFGQVVVMRGHRMDAVSYEEVAHSYRPLASDDMYLTAAEAIGIGLGRSL